MAIINLTSNEDWDPQNLNDLEATPNDLRGNSMGQTKFTERHKIIGNESKVDLKTMIHAVRNSNIQTEKPLLLEGEIEKCHQFLE